MRILRLTPMHKALRELERRGCGLGEREALEVFGGYGDFHTKDYASRVGGLTIWELKPECEQSLRRRFPEAKILITDTFEEICRTSARFGLIVVDNPGCVFGAHCEHFDLLPDLFRVASDDCVMILNVIPSTKGHKNQSQKQLEKRSKFYNYTPEDVPFSKMIEIYSQHCASGLFDLEWHFFLRRKLVWYMVLKLKRFNCH